MSSSGVLLGASSLEQLQENLEACGNMPPLPSRILDAMDQAWELTRPYAFPYWRSYSKDMPQRESLDPGASYETSKKANSKQ